MDINNFVIDRIVRGTMFSTTTQEMLWMVNQVEEPKLNVTTEQAQAVDALGTPIKEFDRAKNAEFSASNSLFDLGLAAAQFGTMKRIATGASKLSVPMFEEIVTETPNQATIVLANVPTGTLGAEIKFIYTLNGDGTVLAKYALAAEATSTAFELDAANKTITLPTVMPAGSRILVPYTYESAAAVEVYNTARDFPKAGKFVMEVLGADVCDPTKLYYAYIIFPNAKLSGDVDITFTTDGKHPFTLKAMQQYCDNEKRLFSIVVPDAVNVA